MSLNTCKIGTCTIFSRTILRKTACKAKYLEKREKTKCYFKQQQKDLFRPVCRYRQYQWSDINS